MRINHPIKQEEFVLPQGMLLSSTTDTLGNIVSANESFVEASGYAWAELVGQPHNILRHPDVPSAVFADLWKTIRNRQPWSQIVKNRRKDGSHYWVEATTVAIVDNDQITGYLSVRRPASRQQIAEAEQAYRAISAGQLHLMGGQPFDLSVKYNYFRHFSPLPLSLITAGTAFTGGLLSFLGIEGATSLAVASGIIALASSYHTILSVRKQGELVVHLENIANNKLSEPIDVMGSNVLAKLSKATKNLQVRLLSDNNRSVELLRNSERLHAGLNKMNAMVMLADQNRTIVYLNPALQNFLKQIEPQLRTALPHFNADDLMGKSIDIFHKHPQHQIDILDRLTSTYIAKISVADQHLQLVINPVIAKNGRRIGTSVEWQDIYQERKIQDDLKTLIARAGDGYLDGRLDSASLSGFYAELATQLNKLMTNTEKAFDDITKAMEKIVQGNLTAKIHSQAQGDLGRLNDNINETVQALRNSFCLVRQSSRDVTDSAQQVAVGNKTLENTIQQQAAAIEETASAMEQITSQVQQASQQAIRSNELADLAKSEVRMGAVAMNESIEAMGAIQAVSAQITGIVTLIDGIAFQTNLLALNAAVEAARAGEHGRGFAVVAGEVRALAQKSAEAAKDIKQLIDQTALRIKDGTTKVQQTGKALEGIIGQVDEMASLINQITHNTKEQAIGLKQMNKAIGQIDQSLQQSASLVGNSALLSQNLGNLASDMDGMVRRFELGVCDNDSPKSSASKQIAGANRPQLPNHSQPKKPNTTASSVPNNHEWGEF
jgi:PAS domain S-box-containing protein